MIYYAMGVLSIFIIHLLISNLSTATVSAQVYLFIASTRQSFDLADKVTDSDSELQSVIFGESFGVPTDLEIGPDGMLYISSLRDGAVYRISR